MYNGQNKQLFGDVKVGRGGRTIKKKKHRIQDNYTRGVGERDPRGTPTRPLMFYISIRFSFHWYSFY